MPEPAKMVTADAEDEAIDMAKPVLPQPPLPVSRHTPLNLSALLLNLSRTPELAVAKLDIYPGYLGEFGVRGSVRITALPALSNGIHVGHLKLQWLLAGVDTLCNETLKSRGYDGVKNACGLHIHEGTACSNHTLVGGHFFHPAHSNETDPWADFTYTANSTGVSEGEGSIGLGLGLADIMSRAFVIHDHTGGRIACGLLHDNSGANWASTSFTVIMGLVIVALGVRL